MSSFLCSTEKTMLNTTCRWRQIATAHDQTGYNTRRSLQARESSGNRKFLYQDGDFVNTPLRDLSSNYEDVRRSLSTKYLSIVPQQDAFISGDSSVVFFDIDPDDTQRTAHGRQEAGTTMGVLEKSQKPRLLHCHGAQSLPLQEPGIDLIAGIKVAIDVLEGLG
ncbi:hypothetical protein VM1G_08185 [Cytospora mali]|uniref:Uncharacterized protein n=1 Tax=Cytospora mali TaxID=578113 RepID=A0A194W8H2_CYTMA|nr:hypothetical protein VM1G_08185 [Valsa mali]